MQKLNYLMDSVMHIFNPNLSLQEEQYKNQPNNCSRLDPYPKYFGINEIAFGSRKVLIHSIRQLARI
jgi:hypothetical protein